MSVASGARARATARTGAGRVAALLAGVLLLAACSEPELAEPDQQPQAEPEPLEAEVDEPNPARDTLVEHIEDFAAAIVEVRELLAPALDADDPQVTRDAAEAAFEAFIGDEDGATVFPGQLSEAERDAAGEDALRATLAQARDTDGDLGTATVNILRDPIAGDLGAWERDPEGMLAGTVAAVDGVEDADAASEAVMALDGEGTRVIAWLALARDTPDDRLAQEAVTQADGHLEAIELALELISDERDDDGDDGGDGDANDGNGS